MDFSNIMLNPEASMEGGNARKYGKICWQAPNMVGLRFNINGVARGFSGD